MVMHASKYPRLNDGYYDRNKSHQYEDKYPSKNHGYSERYNDRHESPSGGGRRGSSREHSPHNRYHNKASYMDRNRERLQKGSSSSPADRRVNHNSSSHGDDRHGTDRRPGNDKKINSSKSSRKDKPDIQKSALRICGDWSEHLSSKGKKYYYNIISEDSKWKKPKEWHDSQARYTDYGMHKEKQRQNGREQSKHHSSNKYDDKHSRTHSGSSSSATAAAEKRDSQQRLVKSFSTPVGAPVSSSPATSTSHSHHPPASSSSSSSSSRSHHHHHHHPERANSMYSSSSSSGSASHRLHQNDSGAHARTIYSSASCGEDSRTSKSSGYDKHSTLDSRDRDRDRREDMLSRRGNGGQRDGLYEGRGSSSSYRGDHHRADRDRGPPPHHHSQHHHHARKDSVNSGYNDSASNGARSVDAYRNDNEDSRQTEDMDISPGSTPSNSRPGSRPSSRISTPITSTPGASATTKGGGVNATSGGSIEKSPSGKQDGQNLTQTIQQLQILQKVLMVQQQLQKQQQQQQLTPQQQSVHSSHHHHHHSSSSAHHHRLNTSGEGDHSPLSEGTPTYEPQHLPPWESGAGGGGILNLPGGGHADHERAAGNAGKHSPRSDCSVRSRKSSPSRSETGSHGNGGGTMQQQPGMSSLAAAAKKQSTAPLSLTPSLSNYYNENLVEHVQGWPSDTVEKQGNHYAQEGHLVGSQHCTQVSVELKRARSLVRIAEIQSTLQEQRVLFLKQQIADLERSQNTYMPPSSSDT